MIRASESNIGHDVSVQFTSKLHTRIAVKHAQGTHQQNDTNNLHKSRGTEYKLYWEWIIINHYQSVFSSCGLSNTIISIVL
jgi:hypothetical protein